MSCVVSATDVIHKATHTGIDSLRNIVFLCIARRPVCVRVRNPTQFPLRVSREVVASTRVADEIHLKVGTAPVGQGDDRSLRGGRKTRRESYKRQGRARGQGVLPRTLFLLKQKRLCFYL